MQALLQHSTYLDNSTTLHLHNVTQSVKGVLYSLSKIVNTLTNLTLHACFQFIAFIFHQAIVLFNVYKGTKLHMHKLLTLQVTKYMQL